MVSGTMSFILALYLFSNECQNSRRPGYPALALLAVLPFMVGILLLSEDDLKYGDEDSRGIQ
ncbi:MAG: hypothetical protein R3293_23200 [Candidatus Promineifilaceae bacterium]|nr:hypothetical protein [Candidatus Promineifilaceae bacterium]